MYFFSFFALIYDHFILFCFVLGVLKLDILEGCVEVKSWEISE